MIELIQADALEWLDAESSKAPRFDLVVTDPPYDSLLKWQGIGTTARMGFGRGKDAEESEKFFPTIDRDEMWKVLCLLDSVTKPDSITYIMCDGVYQPIIMNWVRESGELSWDYSKTLVWDKVSMGMGYHWRSQHEFIVMLQKGKKPLNSFSLPDILRHKRVTGGYPTEKPASLFWELVMNSSQPYDMVLDPFMGGGTTPFVCQELGRNCVAIDKTDRAMKYTRERLNQVAMQPELV